MAATISRSGWKHGLPMRHRHRPLHRRADGGFRQGCAGLRGVSPVIFDHKGKEKGNANKRVIAALIEADML
jgi:hypothetical protein